MAKSFLPIEIHDGNRTSNRATVTKHGAINTHILPPALPESGEAPRRRPFIERVDLHNGGAGHDGSTTPINITLLESDPTNKFNYYIQNIVIVLGGASVPYNRWAGINGGITNGVSLRLDIQGTTDYLAQDIKTNGEFLLFAGGGDLMPSNPATINNYTGTSDALIVTFDLNELIPEAGVSGVEISRGTFDKLVFTIADDLTGTGVKDMFALVKGYKLYE